MFINYSPVNGFSFSTYRNNGFVCGEDILDFCNDVMKDRETNFTMHNTVDYYLDVLEDGEVLGGLSQEVVEDVYNFLKTLK